MPCTWSENGQIAVIQSKQTWCSSLLFRSYFFFKNTTPFHLLPAKISNEKQGRVYPDNKKADLLLKLKVDWCCECLTL